MEACLGEENRPGDDWLGNLKIRKDVSVASWESEKGLAEVIVSKGKSWCCMGVMRSSKLYFNVEEAVYLAGLETLVLLDNNHKIMTIDEIYSLLLIPAHGCSWAAYQTFAYLRRLGYIVGRHGVPWTTSRKRENLIPVMPTGDGDQASSTDEQIDPQEALVESSPLSETSLDVGCKLDSKLTVAESSLMRSRVSQDGETYDNEAGVSTSETGRQDFPQVGAEDTVDILQPLSLLTLNKDEDHLCASLPMYDVFLPNGRFKKSAPGLPAFRLCISSNQPPKHSEVRALELKSGEVPLKFAVVESGNVSIFSFDSVSLPDLL